MRPLELLELARHLPLVVLAATGSVVGVSEAAARVLGCDATELVDRPWAEACMDASEKIEGYVSACARSLHPLPGAFERTIAGACVRFRCEGYACAGEPRYVLLHVTRRESDQGPFALLTQKIDQLNAEVLRREASEEQLRGALARELEAQSAADKANRAKDEFLAMLGHELRNPLAPLSAALHMLSLRGAGKFQKEMGVVERQMKRIAHLVEELLDVSRMACGKITLEERELDVAALVGTVTKKLRPLLESKAQHLYVQVERGLRVEGDAERLVQTFSNLLENAAKYTPAEGNIFFLATQTEDQLLFSVRDTGRGIAPELLARVFEPFVQERQLPDRSQGGLGLGLAIVQSIVGLHGGTVEAKSEGLGFGSEFIVRLPARALPVVGAMATRPAEMQDVLSGTDGGTERGATAARGPQPEAAQPKKILIVDDNVDAADMLGEALRYIGHEVVIAHDAPRALMTLERFKPAVALLDIGLPIMNGYELAEHIRNTESLSAIRLIAVTGYGQPRDREQARAVGFEYHMVKPVDLAMLKRLIEGNGERDRDAAAHA